jgi:hypothetical protein
MPPITEAKKINTVAKSNPATIFFLSATPCRAAGLRSCRRGSNLEDRNLCYAARMMKTPAYSMVGAFWHIPILQVSLRIRPKESKNFWIGTTNIYKTSHIGR